MTLDTLYLKYRPQTIDELDSEGVKKSLNKAMSARTIPHAFLFAGPKGIGKTSAARIVAKMLNCTSKNKPCNRCDQCISITNQTNIDVVEMDAASNRGIDDVRALKDALKLSPVSASKKVYIIDEAHMLTAEASNALLKTLEEPPNHVYFVLATTNPEKLLETIRSRTTIINFRKATKDELKAAIKKVVRKEKIKVDNEVISKIVSASGGSFRDAIKMLEQAGVLRDSSQIFSGIDAEEIVSTLERGDVKNVLAKITDLIDRGVSGELITDLLINRLRSILLSYHGLGEKIDCMIPENDLICLIELILENKNYTKVTPLEELPLELAIVKWVKLKFPNSGKDLEKVEKTINKKSINGKVWKSVLDNLKKINPSIEALLRSSQPVDYDNGCLKLAVYYKFHKERLDEVRNRKLVEETVSDVLKGPVKVECVIQEKPKTVLTGGASTDIINEAEKIFK